MMPAAVMGTVVELVAVSVTGYRTTDTADDRSHGPGHHRASDSAANRAFCGVASRKRACGKGGEAR